MGLASKSQDVLAASKEVLIETRSGEHSYRTVIWVVEGDGYLYIRSFLGDSGVWYQRTLTDPKVALIVGDVRVDFRAVPAVDERSIELASERFREKYPNSRSLAAMLVPEVLHTTLRLEPTGTPDDP